MNLPALTIFFANCALYFFIGHSLRQKRLADAEDARGWCAFLFWWYGMAANTGLNGLAVLAMGLGITWLPLLIALNALAALAAAPALWGLLSYLLYIFRGNHTASRWLGRFYALFGIFLLASIYLLHPVGASMGTWEMTLQYANVPSGLFGLLYGVLLILLLSLPPILASIGMFTLFFRVRERSARFRALLVPLGFFLLFGLAYFIPLILLLLGINLNTITWWPLAIRLIGLAALGLIYIAYFPPRAVQRLLRVHSILV